MDYLIYKFNEINSLIKNPTKENLDKLFELLIIRDDDTYGKHEIHRYCAQTFIHLGINGIDKLKEAIFHVSETTSSPVVLSSILEVLYSTSLGKHYSPIFSIGLDSNHKTEPKITNEMKLHAYRTLKEIVAKSLNDLSLFSSITIFLNQQDTRSTSKEEGIAFQKFVFEVFRESSLKINGEMLNDFRKLISESTNEERYQKFIENNPGLIDPIAMEIINKQKLGAEFITDFVVRKLDNSYILVEIEKPSTSIFTKSNDLSSDFSHALGQVLDFQEWVESNISYAQKIMPEITSPTGLLIIGLSSDLNDFQKRKLRRFNINNKGNLEVVTFDELLNRSVKLYENMIF